MIYTLCLIFGLIVGCWAGEKWRPRHMAAKAVDNWIATHGEKVTEAELRNIGDIMAHEGTG